jgi:uroporphyrinogen decarboxylase
MTHRERVQTALGHQQPDRCPLQASFTPEFARRLRFDLEEKGLLASPPSGKPSGRLRSAFDGHNPHGGGNRYELEIALDEDLLLTSVGWADSYYQGDAYTDEWGIGWKAVEYATRFGPGRYTEMMSHPLADDAAVASYKPPDPERPELYAEARRVVERFGAEYWIVGVTVTTVFETAWALRGLDRMLMDLALDPDLAMRILDIPFRYHLAAARRLASLGVDMIWTGDDVGAQNAMMISPAHWRKFLKPLMARFFAEVKAVNPRVKLAYHSDGNIEPIIPDLIEMGLDVLNPVQPAAMDPGALKKKYGKRLCFWGCIDEQRTLPFAAPQDVRSEVRDRIATVGAGGGLIVGPTHHVQLDTPLENFWAMVEAVRG